MFTTIFGKKVDDYMKNIKVFNAEKYQSNSYQKVSDNVYKAASSIDNKFKPVNDSEILNATDWIRENGIDTLIYNDIKYIKINGNVFKQEISEDNYYVISLSFEQEPEFNENANNKTISQYPLEDILDKFNVYISDEYKELNNGDSNTCYLEFASSSMEDIENLKSIIGKHVYNKEENGVIKLIIE